LKRCSNSFSSENPHFLVDQAQDGGPGEVAVQVLDGRLGAVQGQQPDFPVFDQGLHLFREAVHELAAALGGVDHQKPVFLEAAHVLPQNLVREKFFVKEGQHVSLGEFTGLLRMGWEDRRRFMNTGAPLRAAP
jgi:hypothetical protein